LKGVEAGASGLKAMGDGRRETNERRERKSSRNEVHNANAVV
jgi:hypothetical protein